MPEPHRLEPWPRWLGDIPSGDPNDPRPFFVPGVRVRFARASRSLKRRAQVAASGLLGEAGENEHHDPLNLADAGDAFSEEMIRRGIVEWEGIGDAEGSTLPVSPEAIEMFIADPDLFDRADQLYVLPEVLRDAEKNGLSASPAGTGEAETPAADIASSAAAAATDAASAPTSSRNRKPKPGRKSGT